MNPTTIISARMKNEKRGRLPRLLPGFLGPALLLFTWTRGDGGLFLLLCSCALVAAGEYVYEFLSTPGPSPYPLMLLSPLLLINYASIEDFRIRLACFIMLTYVIVLSRRAPRQLPRFPGAGPGQAWALALLVFALTAILFHTQGIQLSGDEPHYVMIAQSLVEDGDFDLKNNIENKTYFSYLPVEIRFHGSIHAGSYHSFHLPGLSFLLAPFFFLFKITGGQFPGGLYFRLVAAFINSFFALALFLALSKLLTGKKEGGFFVFFLLTFPLSFHGVHLFPELPAAALIVFAYLYARERKQYFIAGLLLAGIPWFHLKYAVPTMILALFTVHWIVHESRGNGFLPLKRLAAFFSAPVLSMAMLALYSRMLYGSFDPRAISPEKNFLAIPFHFRIETLLSFFLDQRDGLLVYAPVFLLLFLAFRKDIRVHIRDFGLLSALFLPYILFHAFTTVRGGYSPAARPTVFAMWIMAVFLAAVYRHATSNILRTLFRLLAGLTTFATVWLMYYPLFLYQPVTREVSQRASSLLWFLGSEAIDLASFFPSFLKLDNTGHWPNTAWLVVLAIGLAVYYARIARPLPAKAADAAVIALGLGMLFLFCYFPHVRLQTRYASGGLSFFCNSKNFTSRSAPPGFRVLAGQNYDLYFDLKGSASDTVNLQIFAAERVALKIRNGRTLLLETSGDPGRRLDLSLRRLKRVSLPGRDIVHIGLETAPLEGRSVFGLRFE